MPIIHLKSSLSLTAVSSKESYGVCPWVSGIVKWESMEEAREIGYKSESTKSSSPYIIESFAIIKWFAEKKILNIIKIIIEDDQPLYLDLAKIKNSSDLYKILKERIRFVRS